MFKFRAPFAVLQGSWGQGLKLRMAFRILYRVWEFSLGGLWDSGFIGFGSAGTQDLVWACGEGFRLSGLAAFPYGSVCPLAVLLESLLCMTS